MHCKFGCMSSIPVSRTRESDMVQLLAQPRKWQGDVGECWSKINRWLWVPFQSDSNVYPGGQVVAGIYLSKNIMISFWSTYPLDWPCFELSIGSWIPALVAYIVDTHGTHELFGHVPIPHRQDKWSLCFHWASLPRGSNHHLHKRGQTLVQKWLELVVPMMPPGHLMISIGNGRLIA